MLSHGRRCCLLPEQWETPLPCPRTGTLESDQVIQQSSNVSQGEPDRAGGKWGAGDELCPPWTRRSRWHRTPCPGWMKASAVWLSTERLPAPLALPNCVEEQAVRRESGRRSPARARAGGQAALISVLGHDGRSGASSGTRRRCSPHPTSLSPAAVSECTLVPEPQGHSSGNPPSPAGGLSLALLPWGVPGHPAAAGPA